MHREPRAAYRSAHASDAVEHIDTLIEMLERELARDDLLQLAARHEAPVTTALVSQERNVSRHERAEHLDPRCAHMGNEHLHAADEERTVLLERQGRTIERKRLL